MWHKRLLLYPASRDKSHWICVTPDEDIYEEALCETDPENWAIRSFGLRDFADSPQERRQGIYDFDGAPSLDQVKEWMRVARAESRKVLASRGEELAEDPRVWIGSDGKRYVLPGFAEVKQGPSHRIPRKQQQALPAGDDGGAGNEEEEIVGETVWLALEKTEHGNPGDVIADASVQTAVGNHGVARISSSVFFVVKVGEAGHKSSFKDVAKVLCSDWRDASVIDDDVDARVLPIMYQGGRVEKRHRRWREVADAITEEQFDDWPLEDSVRSVEWMVQQIAKGDRGPVDYVDSYLARHPYQPSDRSQFELKCLAEILEAAGCYDQLNLSSLAWVETLARRWQMILDAHARNPLAPNYEASEFYSGSRRGRHGIAPILSAHVAKVMKDESEIDKQRNKARDAHDAPKGGDKGRK